MRVNDLLLEHIRTCSPQDWQQDVEHFPIRRQMHFVVLALLDRSTHRRKDGKGFNQHDLALAEESYLFASTSYMPLEELRQWAVRLFKYRGQLREFGCAYPDILFEEVA